MTKEINKRILRRLLVSDKNPKLDFTLAANENHVKQQHTQP
jgi:hypothetical protein